MLGGPSAPDPRWQAPSNVGFAPADVTSDWQEKHDRCPQGCQRVL
jgi:hypothetical protein